MTASANAIIRFITRMGGLPVILDNHATHPQLSAHTLAMQDIALLDGIVVMGNDEDLHPETYGDDTIHPATSIERCNKRAKYEFSLLELAIARKLPILAICGGMHRLNIVAGGTLHQHVPDLLGKKQQYFSKWQGFVHVQKNTLLGSWCNDYLHQGKTDAQAQSLIFNETKFHHQCVDKLGAGLNVNATSSAGIIEAIEADKDGVFGNQFMIGLQFHPEFNQSAFGSMIVQRFIASTQLHAYH